MMPFDQSVREDTPAGFLGSLADTPLAEVFRRIVSEERSGDLQVTTPEAIKTVYFDRGFIVFASSNRKSDRLGESMIEAGRISRRDFAAASELMKTSRLRFGKALVSSGIVSEEELGRYVAAQVNRIVLSLFSAQRGMYSFDERPTVIPMNLMVSLSVYRILMEGIRHMKSQKLVLTGLPSLDTEVKVVDRPPFALDVETLRPMERSVLKAAGDAAAMRAVIDEVGDNEGAVLRALYGLIAAGVLETKSAQVRHPLNVQLETGTFVLSEIGEKVSAPGPTLPKPPPRPAVPDPPAGIRERLENLWTSFLEWLGVTREAPSTLGIAPPRVAPRPRPAAARRVETPDPVGVAVPSWSVVDAPETEVSSDVFEKSHVPEWSVAENPADQFRDFFEEQGMASRSVTEDDAPSMFAPIPIEEVALGEENIALELEDEVDILLEVETAEVPPEPEPETTLPAEPAVSVVPTPSPVRSGVADAPPTEEEPEDAKPTGTTTENEATSIAREQARRRIEQGGGEGRLVRDVKLHFKLRDWGGAVPLLEQLIEICPGKAIYRGMLARALSRHPSRRKEAEAQFIEALKLSPRDAEIHYWLGLYYKSFGLGSRALNEFKTTLRINPRHEGARRQLGTGKKSDDALGSVIKKLFG